MLPARPGVLAGSAPSPRFNSGAPILESLIMSNETWEPPPHGTVTTQGEDVARTATGELVFTHDPLRRAPLRQPKSPRPAAKDYPGRAEE